MVAAFSAGRGKGSEFIVRIPMIIRFAGSDVSPVPPVPAGTRNVLVVDDNVDAAECIGVMLKLSGHQVEVVHDGFEAVEAARRHKPDVILLDIGLPGRDGYEVARILRRESDLKNTKIIAVSGYGKEEDRALSKQAGMDDHLTKPVDHDRLEEVLRAVAS
jgi:CheY-like chemotaxis protein